MNQLPLDAPSSEASKRIDSLYNNIKQLPALVVIGILMPIFGLICLPVAIYLWRLRQKLLVEVAEAQIDLPQGDKAPKDKFGVTDFEKVEYIRERGVLIWTPAIVGGLYFLIVVFVMVVFVASFFGFQI